MGNAAISTFFTTNLMKRNLLLLTVMMIALSCALPAQAQTAKRLFNGTNFDGWEFKAGNRQNVWTVGRLAGNTVEESATTMVAIPLRGGAPGAPTAARAGTPAAQAPMATGVMINPTATAGDPNGSPRGVDIYTTEKFGDCTVKVEFLILRGGNSGVYLMGEYEVQIADSFGRPANRPLGQGDMGAVYSAAAPTRNAAGAPGTWQSFVIEFVAPKFDADGNKTANGLFKKITLNGIVVQENVEVQGPTGGGLTMKEAPTGPLMFQGDHGPVAFRNVEIILP